MTVFLLNSMSSSSQYDSYHFIEFEILCTKLINPTSSFSVIYAEGESSNRIFMVADKPVNCTFALSLHTLQPTQSNNWVMFLKDAFITSLRLALDASANKLLSINVGFGKDFT